MTSKYKKEHDELIKEIQTCEGSLERQLGFWTKNAISRLIEARIKLHELEKEKGEGVK